MPSHSRSFSTPTLQDRTGRHVDPDKLEITRGPEGWLDDEDWKTIETAGLPDGSRFQDTGSERSDVRRLLFRPTQQRSTNYRRVLHAACRPPRIPEAGRRRSSRVSSSSSSEQRPTQLRPPARDDAGSHVCPAAGIGRQRARRVLRRCWPRPRLARAEFTNQRVSNLDCRTWNLSVVFVFRFNLQTLDEACPFARDCSFVA